MKISSIAESLDDAKAIDGVTFKDLKSFPDDRGFFRELIRVSDPFFSDGFAQWSHSKMGKNTVKAWHFHHRQTDWWYCPFGLLQTVLIDRREESPTAGRILEFFLGDADEYPQALSTVVRIPPGVFHGCKVLSPAAHLFYITSNIYDPNDEGREPFDSPEVNYHWGDKIELIVSERDMKRFIPPHPRER